MGEGGVREVRHTRKASENLYGVTRHKMSYDVREQNAASSLSLCPGNRAISILGIVVLSTILTLIVRLG